MTFNAVLDICFLVLQYSTNMSRDLTKVILTEIILNQNIFFISDACVPRILHSSQNEAAVGEQIA